MDSDFPLSPLRDYYVSRRGQQACRDMMWEPTDSPEWDRLFYLAEDAHMSLMVRCDAYSPSVPAPRITSGA